eukprot:Selendium_serpulae@DN3644_c1_g1_i1.p4
MVDCINKLDTVVVLIFGLIGALISEGLPWLFVYRKPTFMGLKNDFVKAHRKIEHEKLYRSKTAKKDSKIKGQEEQQQRRSQQIQMTRMKANFMSIIVFVVVVPVLYGIYDGVVVAKLPFTPKLMVATLSHQTLGGNDFTDCSMMFLYAVSAMFFRNNLQRLMGTTPPLGMASGGSMFGQQKAQ